MSGLPYIECMKTLRSDSFKKWFQDLPNRTQLQIEARLSRVEKDNHLGHHKHLKGHLWELKFNDGTRIYYTIKKVGEKTMFLILGGNKNGQNKDINKAEKTADQIHAEES
ncbi:type II toxin-antitoxin system RelE/ParE family toxin [Bdellovibrio bacteriovorus]|uniref:type II toxin-antitoxin system RelE/ParE family toxin n=1 Tax=Bdellovibrio bacteriovorus TaxID=959 RepID=UPI003AA7DA53